MIYRASSSLKASITKAFRSNQWYEHPNSWLLWGFSSIVLPITGCLCENEIKNGLSPVKGAHGTDKGLCIFSNEMCLLHLYCPYSAVSTPCGRCVCSYAIFAISQAVR